MYGLLLTVCFGQKWMVQSKLSNVNGRLISRDKVELGLFYFVYNDVKVWNINFDLYFEKVFTTRKAYGHFDIPLRS